MATTTLPAGTLSYREAGPVDGRPVVFVHGFLVDDTLWSDVPERLAAQGFRTLAPTWPLGAHTAPLRPGTDLSVRGVARIVLDFLAAHDLRDVVLVGNDSGGAISQLLLDEDASRIGALVLTNCDAFDTFPPFPFDLLFRLARRPVAARALLQLMRPARVRNSRLGFGWLVHRRLGAEESRRWVTPFLTQPGVRRDVSAFAQGWTGSELSRAEDWLRRFDRPVLICWGPKDPFFRLALGRRLAATFPDARLVEIEDALTFVALDQPARLAEEIAAFLGSSRVTGCRSTPSSSTGAGR